MRPATYLLTVGLFLPSAGARAADPPAGWEFVGRTQAVATVEAKARVTGYVTRVSVKEGVAVKKGDLLIEIDPRPYQLDLDAALARVKVAEARLKEAQLKAANATRLFQKHVISQDEVALNTAPVAEAEAGVAGAKVDVERAKLNLSWTRITAPFDGRVGGIRATPGNLAVADQTPILTVLASHTLYVSFNVPEGVLLRLRRDGLADPGELDVAVTFAGDKAYSPDAKLDAIEPEVDPATGTARFRATIENPKGLLSPGMSAHVRLSPAPK